MRNLTENEKGPNKQRDAQAGWLRQRLGELGRLPLMPGVHLSEEIERLQSRLRKLQHESRRHDTWVTVELARNKERPRTRDYIGYLIDGFEELKGDRLRADDRGVVGAQAVALELLKAVDQVADIVAGPRALLVARHLDRDPRVMATAFVLQFPQAALQPLDLLRQVHAGH